MTYHSAYDCVNKLNDATDRYYLTSEFYFDVLNTGNYVYYFAYKDKRRIVEKEEYLAAWHKYWIDIQNWHCSFSAIHNMICEYGGVARKQQIPEINGIYNKEIGVLCSLIHNDIERELDQN